jgi:TP901 family phage tail tape measure protein
MARRNQVAFNTGQMGHDEYRKFLLGQLTATEEYGTRWKRVWDEIIRVDRLIEQHRKATENPTGGKGSSEKKPGVSTPFAEQDPHFKSAQWEEAMKKGANPAMLMANTFLPRNTKGRVIANVANALDKVGLKWDQLGIGYSPFDMAQMGLQAFQEREEAQMLGDLELRSNAAQQKANKKPFDSEADIQALNKRIRKAAMETLPIKGGVVSLMKIKEAIASEGISAKDLDMPLDAIARFQKFNQGMGPEDIAHNAAQTIESMEHTILKDAIKRGVVPQGTTNVYDKRIDAVGNLLGGIEYGKFNTRATAPQIMVLVSKMAGVSNSVGLSLQDNISLSSAMADMKITPGQGTTAVSKTIRALFTAADSYQGNGKYDKNLGLLSQVLYGAKGQEAIDEGAKQFAQTFRSSPIKAIGEFIDKLQIMQKQGQNIPTLFKAMGLGGDRMAQTMTQLAGAEKPFSEFAKGMEDIGNKSAWLKKTSEPLLNDVNSKIEKFTAHIREFAAMFIEAFSGKIEIVLNIFKQFMDVVGHVVEGFAAMPDGLKNVIISTVAVVMAMRGLAGVLAPVVQGFSSLYQLWTSYTELGFIKGVLIPAKEAMLGEAAATTEDTLAKEANTVALEQNTAAAIENKEAHSGFTGILDGFIGKWGELSLVLAGIALAYDGITKAQKAYQASAKNDAPLPKVHNWLPGDPNKPDSNAHDATVKKFKDVNTGPADPAQKDFFNLWGNIGESFDKLDNADARFRAIKSDPVAITLFKKQQALSDKKLIQLWAKNNPNYADMNRGQLPDDLKRALGRHGVGADWSVKDSIETGISRADADYVDARKWGAKYLKSAKQEDSLVGTPAMNALTGGTPSLSESYSKPVVDTLTGKNLSIDGKTDLKSILGQTQYQLTPAQQAKLAADKYGEQKNRAENDMADVKQKIKDSLDAMKEGKTTLEGKVLTKSILYGYAEQLRGATKQRDDAVLAAEKLEKQAKGFALDAKTIQGERAKLAGARDREYDSETAQIDEALKAVRKKRLDNEIQALEASKKNLESQKEELDAQLSMALGVQEKHQIRTQILAKEREIMDKEFQVQLKRIEKMDKGAEKDKAKDEYVQGRTTRERVYNINKSKEGRDTILELLDERAGLSSADSWMDRTEADRMKRENFADKSKLGMNSLMQWFGGEPIMSPAEKRMAWARIQGRTDKLDEFNQSRQLALDEVGISDGENATDNYQRLLSYNKKKRAYLQFFKPDELDQFNAQSKIAERKAGRESSLDQMEEALSGFGLGKVGAGASVQSARGFFEMAMGRSVSDAEKSATAGSYLQNLERAYNGSFSTTGKLDQDSISKVLREMGLVRQDAKSRGDLGTYLQSGEQMGSLIQSIMSMQYERIDKSGLQEADRYKAIRATNELLKMIPEWQSLPPDIIKSLSEGMDERERKFRDNQPFRKAGLEARRSFEGSIDGDVEGLGSKLIEGAFKGHKVNKKEAYKQFWDEILGTGTQSLAHVAWSGVIKPEMTKVFDGLKEGLLEIWHGGEASWGQMINASLTALNAIMLAGAGGKKAQKGGLLGGLLGGVLGFAIGGPAGALEGFNIGAAAGAAYSTGGLGAGLLAGGGSYVAYRGPGMFGVGSQAASATGGSTGYRQTLGMASGSNPLGGTLGGFAHKSEQVPGIQINQTLIVPDKSVADYAAQRTGNRIYRATNVGK